MRVPGYEPNTNLAPLPGVRYNDVPEAAAFGGVNARAQQTAGLQVAGTGNDMIALSMQMKRDNDTLAAKEAYLKFKDESRDFLWNDKTGIFARQGLNAQTSMEDTDQFFSDAAERHSQDLNGSQRSMFNSFVLQDRDNTLDSVARHKQQQLSTYQDSQDLALAGNTVDDAGLNYNDPKAIATAKLNMNHAFDSWANRRGDLSQDKDGNIIEGDKTRTLRSAYLSKINSSVMSAALARDDFKYASNYLKEMGDKKEFNSDELDKWTALIKTRTDYSDLMKAANMDMDGTREKLTETNQDGSFKNWPNLGEGTRSKAQSYVDELIRDRDNKGNDTLIELAGQGKLDKDVIKTAVDQKMISIKQGYQWEKSLDTIYKQEKTEAYRKKKLNMQVELALMDMPEDPKAQAVAKAEWNKKCLDAENGDPMPDLINDFTAKIKEANTVTYAYRKTQGYRDGIAVIGDTWRKTKGKTLSSIGLTYRPWGLFNNIETQEFQDAKHIELINAFDNYVKNNPDESAENQMKWIKSNVSALNSGNIKGFVPAIFAPGAAQKATLPPVGPVKSAVSPVPAKIQLGPDEQPAWDKTTGASYIVNTKTNAIRKAE